MATPPHMPRPDGEEDYTASATLIPFDRPLPLLRVPIPSGTSDDPASGPLVLAFKSPHAFHSALQACESKIAGQCEDAARIGCAVAASSKCKPPWWRTVFGSGRGALDLEERERCEEREMAICFAASKENCVKFAKDKCLPAFRDARIAVDDRGAVARKASKLIFCSTMANGHGLWSLLGIPQLCEWASANSEGDLMFCRGSTLLCSHNQ